MFEENEVELENIIHYFYQKGWCPATSSNYSFREENSENFIVTRSGIDKSKFKKSDLLKVDYELNIQNKTDYLVSAEGLIHSTIYKLGGKNIGAILHTHSIYNTILSKIIDDAKESMVGKLEITGYEIQKGFEGVKSHLESVEIPVFSNNQDMNPLCLEIEDYLITNPKIVALLIGGHGLYCWGKDLSQAKRHIETAEFLFECVWKKDYQNR